MSCMKVSKKPGVVRSPVTAMENKSLYFSPRVFVSLALTRDLCPGDFDLTLKQKVHDMGADKAHDAGQENIAGR